MFAGSGLVEEERSVLSPSRVGFWKGLCLISPFSTLFFFSEKRPVEVCAVTTRVWEDVEVEQRLKKFWPF